MTETPRYTAIAIALHWVIGLGIIGMIALGWYMGDLPNTAPNKFALYQLHKSLGIAILILTLARIAWRVLNPPPPLPETMASWEKQLSHFAHIAFYALMILMPLTGWIWVSASPAGVPTKLFGVIDWPHLPILADMSMEAKRASDEVLHNVHGKLAWVVIPLIGIHVAGALKHDFIDKEGAVLRRMLPGLFGNAAPPEQPARGIATAFGGAFAVFFAIVALPVVFAGTQNNGAATAPLGADADFEPNWAVDYDASDIRVLGILSGYPTPAIFPDWSATILFDETNIASGRAVIQLNSTSATANDAYLDDTLAQEDWLGTSDYPSIDVEVYNMRAEGDEYLADLTYTLKGQTFEDALPFTLEIVDNTATLSASLTVDRFVIGIGANADPSKEWIDAPLEVQIKVVASRVE